MQRIIVGTAGHVDHGKTVLTKRLTGIDTDRLREEKERGISIELGFAPLTLPSGIKVGLVDVPGHERFIKNMLAGIAGIDLVLLVIAADEGVMPQTREHLDIINLLEVKKGIVVITKADLVDEEWLELVQQEVSEVLAGTVLENAPMMAVSAVTGQGISELLTIIDKLAQETPPKEISGRARIPIDRVFTITGFGTVITGTLWSGRLEVGETVEILPAGHSARIRTLQVHGEKVKQATAGQRVAVNLAGLETDDIARGDVLAEPGLLEPVFRLDVKLRILKHPDISLEQRARVRVHQGTREVLGRVNLLDREELRPGEECLCQLVLESPLMALRGDHYVIRSYSPMITIGGGIVIDPMPPKHKRYRTDVIENLEVMSHGDPKELISQVLADSKAGMMTIGEISKATGLAEQQVIEETSALANENKVTVIKGEGSVFYLWKEKDNLWLSNVIKRLDEYHKKYPLRPGIAKEELRSRDFPQILSKAFNRLLEAWESAGKIKVLGQAIAKEGFIINLSPEQDKAKGIIEKALLREPFSPPGWDEAADLAGLSEEEKVEMLGYLQQSGVVVKLSEEVILHQTAFDTAKEKIVSYLKENGKIQLSETRDILKTSRKYALPLIEYLDQIKVTKRKGDLRILL
ncbi:MAG: selenocysteine-specific translation elongation factor [Desulfitobacteriaceae bacterium]|nr:selenocysteine-specific translation elongation factor [Desulfitobacteriaceae bacterium]